MEELQMELENKIRNLVWTVCWRLHHGSKAGCGKFSEVAVRRDSMSSVKRGHLPVSLTGKS